MIKRFKSVTQVTQNTKTLETGEHWLAVQVTSLRCVIPSATFPGKPRKPTGKSVLKLPVEGRSTQKLCEDKHKGISGGLYGRGLM